MSEDDIMQKVLDLSGQRS